MLARDGCHGFFADSDVRDWRLTYGLSASHYGRSREGGKPVVNRGCAATDRAVHGKSDHDGRSPSTDLDTEKSTSTEDDQCTLETISFSFPPCP